MGKSIFLMKSIIVLFFGIIILCLDLYGIQKPEWQGKIEYENGVEVIKNPNEPQYGEITLELVEDLLIEDKDGKDYFFQWLCDVNVDSKGNIYVLDRQQHKALIFDKQGNYIKEIGGKGQGPGEFNTPTRIVIDGEDQINVLENRRLHLFDNKADFIKSINFNFSVFSCSLTENGNILAHSMEMGPKGASQRILALNSEGNITKTIDDFSVDLDDLKNPSSMKTAIRPFFFLSPLDNESSIYGNPAEYRLYVIDSSGGKVRIIERDESQKRELYFDGLFTNEDGLIFVRRRVVVKEKGEPIPFDIFNNKGHYIYKAFTNGVSTKTIRAGYLYEIDYASDSGAFFVKRYKIKNWDQIKEGISD